MITDYTAAREQMVDCQVRTSDVTSHSLLKAMLSVPKEAFVPEHLAELAYIDDDLSLAKMGGEGRYLMAAASFAKMAQHLDVQPSDVVMVVGSGSGYSAAVFSQMATSVVAIEEDEALVAASTERLSENGFDNVVVLEKTLSEGCAKEAPYDAIFVEGSVEFLPDTLLDQLAENGRLIAVLGAGNAAKAAVYEKREGLVSRRDVMNYSVKPLPGFERKEEFVF